MAISLGRDIAKKVLAGKAYGVGEYLPPGRYRVKMQSFTYADSDNEKGSYFKTQFTVSQVLSGGEKWEKGDVQSRAVKVGDERVQMMMMMFQAAAGDVANLVGAGLGAWLEMEGSVPWQDYEILKSLLTHFNIDEGRFSKVKPEDKPGAMCSALLEALIDPEENPFNGIELEVHVAEKLTRTNKKWICVHRWEVPGAESAEE